MDQNNSNPPNNPGGNSPQSTTPNQTADEPSWLPPLGTSGEQQSPLNPPASPWNNLSQTPAQQPQSDQTGQPQTATADIAIQSSILASANQPAFQPSDPALQNQGSAKSNLASASPPSPDLNHTPDSLVSQVLSPQPQTGIGQTPSIQQTPPQQPASDTPDIPEALHVSSEPAPTDLSQLTGDNNPPPPEIYTPPLSTNGSATENPMAVPAHGQTPEHIKTEPSSQSIPKALIFGGIFLVLAVTTASVYFFFLKDKQGTDDSKTTKTPASVATPRPSQTPTPESEEEESQGFGALNQNSASPSASPVSALERLRQRQQSK